MKIYDISQEVFSSCVYPGDPAPQRIRLSQMREGALYNLTAFQMCAHNGTHIDAPYHFLKDGKTTDEIDPVKFVGYCYVAEFSGDMKAADAQRILKKAEMAEQEKQLAKERASARILVKGNAVVTEEAAQVLADQGIFLFGNKSQTVGPENAPMAVHLLLLRAEIVLLEGIRLGEVQEGIYFLSAAPLNLGGADGAPCRAVLVDFEK